MANKPAEKVEFCENCEAPVLDAVRHVVDNENRVFCSADCADIFIGQTNYQKRRQAGVVQESTFSAYGPKENPDQVDALAFAIDAAKHGRDETIVVETIVVGRRELFEAIHAVANAWNNAGRAPHVHDLAKRKLRAEWRTLANAVERVADLLRK